MSRYFENGGMIGHKGYSPFSSSLGGMWSLSGAEREVRSLLPTTDQLFFQLDASNTASYPGTGTTWYDLSGNGNDYTLSSANLWNSSGYMSFQNSTDMALRSGSQATAGNISYVVVTIPKTDNTNWRTLTRGSSADHHVIIEGGGWNIGMYDNDGTAFMSTGFSQQSIPNYSTDFNVLIWRWQTSTPQYELFVNGASVGTISNSSATHNGDLYALGNYQGNDQPFGDIAYFAAYEKWLSDDEVLTNTSALAYIFNL